MCGMHSMRGETPINTSDKIDIRTLLNNDFYLKLKTAKRIAPFLANRSAIELFLSFLLVENVIKTNFLGIEQGYLLLKEHVKFYSIDEKTIDEYFLKVLKELKKKKTLQILKVPDKFQSKIKENGVILITNFAKSAFLSEDKSYLFYRGSITVETFNTIVHKFLHEYAVSEVLLELFRRNCYVMYFLTENVLKKLENNPGIDAKVFLISLRREQAMKFDIEVVTDSSGYSPKNILMKIKKNPYNLWFCTSFSGYEKLKVLAKNNVFLLERIAHLLRAKSEPKYWEDTLKEKIMEISIIDYIDNNDKEVVQFAQELRKYTKKPQKEHNDILSKKLQKQLTPGEQTSEVSTESFKTNFVKKMYHNYLAENEANIRLCHQITDDLSYPKTSTTPLSKKIDERQEFSKNEHNETVDLSKHTLPIIDVKEESCEKDLSNLSSTEITIKQEENGIEEPISQSLEKVSQTNKPMLIIQEDTRNLDYSTFSRQKEIKYEKLFACNDIEKEIYETLMQFTEVIGGITMQTASLLIGRHPVTARKYLAKLESAGLLMSVYQRLIPWEQLGRGFKLFVKPGNLSLQITLIQNLTIQTLLAKGFIVKITENGKLYAKKCNKTYRILIWDIFRKDYGSAFAAQMIKDIINKQVIIVTTLFEDYSIIVKLYGEKENILCLSIESDYSSRLTSSQSPKGGGISGV